MTAQAKPTRSAGRGFLYMLIGLVLWAAVVLFVRNNDYFIDRFGVFVDWRLWLALFAAVFIGAMFWIQGHRVYAASKGLSQLLGLALAFLPIVGLLVLLVAPARKRAVQPPGEAEAEPPAVGDQA